MIKTDSETAWDSMPFRIQSYAFLYSLVLNLLSNSLLILCVSAATVGADRGLPVPPDMIVAVSPTETFAMPVMSTES